MARRLPGARSTSLSAQDLDAIERFYQKGGQVFVNDNSTINAYVKLTQYDKKERSYEEKVFIPPFTPANLPELTGILPLATALEASLGVQALQGDNYTFVGTYQFIFNKKEYGCQASR